MDKGYLWTMNLVVVIELFFREREERVKGRERREGGGEGGRKREERGGRERERETKDCFEPLHSFAH